MILFKKYIKVVEKYWKPFLRLDLSNFFMDEKLVISETGTYIREKLSGEGSGHDWWHIFRVWTLAKSIQIIEGGNLYVIELSSLLHDIADWKFHDGDHSVGPNLAGEWLASLNVSGDIVSYVCEIIRDVSFKGEGVKSNMLTLEGKIVQDADRLDAIGAIGIARTFAYGGHKGREIYNPNIKPEIHENFEQYKIGECPTINHFYEKLLLLKDRMNTETGKRFAEGRHKFMEQFLDRFYKEFSGKS
jgi:uncharacterized protein